MARDGSGGYNLPELPFVFDTVIEETKVNNNFTDLGNEIANSIAKNGETDPTGNLPMAGFRHTGVGNASARTDYPATGQVQDGAFLYGGTAGGTANALTISLTPAVTALVAGMEFIFKASASANTGAATIAVNGIAAVALQLNDAALTGGEIAANKWYRGLYDGTAVQIQRLSVPGVGDLLAANNLSDVANAATALSNLGAQADLDVPSQAEAEAGTATTERVWTAQRVGQAIAAQSTSISQATQAAIEAETNEDTYVPPDLIKHSPGVAKGWINFNGTGTIAINESHNVTSIADNGTGLYTITWDTDFATANYSVGGAAQSTGSGSRIVETQTFAVGTLQITTVDDANSAADSNPVCVQAFGDQ